MWQKWPPGIFISNQCKIINKRNDFVANPIDKALNGLGGGGLKFPKNASRNWRIALFLNVAIPDILIINFLNLRKIENYDFIVNSN